MACVAVGLSFDLVRSKRQHRLAPIERLELRLLIDAENDRMLRGRDVEADLVTRLGDEVGIGG